MSRGLAQVQADIFLNKFQALLFLTLSDGSILIVLLVIIYLSLDD